MTALKLALAHQLELMQCLYYVVRATDNNVFETARRKILNNSEFNVFKQKNIENGFFVCFLVILSSFF